ncbi:MAG: 2-amino-4-hydroxy-6-hydroxymethyldihydropteridine diphosphokinase [SAR202 cluster bacterium]|nr:2-amino-4-hydroxy-6-hydroxymethyldihydropteridine diphosphokinase [SAR202 cluster bacterium]|tara:strand:+ start:8851 stop:9348 length:498 start_codon:yes stop_codon:yes gene_type:complete
MTNIFLGLGTNIGDRKNNLCDTVIQLQPEISIDQMSSMFETKPVGHLDQPDFLNMVIRARTDLDIHDLLEKAKLVEAQLGRENTIRYGPRIIDIDILLYGDKQFTSPNLVIPHPRMLERAFVMIPLAEIAPLLIIPGASKPAAEIARAWDGTDEVHWHHSPPKTP